MVGNIMQGKEQRRKQVFRQIAPPGCSIGPKDANGSYTFIPWRGSSTRDAAPSKPSTIGEAHRMQHVSIEKVVGLMGDIATRISALEMKRSAQARLAEQMLQQQQSRQQPPTEQPTHQPTQDHAPCSCQSPAPQAPYRDGVTTMDRNSQLAPNRNLTFGAFPNPRMATRDQGNSLEANYLEKPSRFSSAEADRMANYLPPGSAGRTSNKEAVNDINLRTLRDSAGHNVSGPPQPAMTQGSDLSSAFASELQKIPPGQPAAAQNVLNKHYNAAKTSDARDGIERVWRDFMARYDARGGNPFAPRQPAHDAPWSNLYEANKGTIGGDPNKIQIGQQLDLGGGQTHTVAKGETLSGIASSAASSGAPTPPSRPAGFGESYGQGQEPGGAASRNVQQMLKSPTESTNTGAANAPLPPERPAGLGGQSAGGGDVPTPPVKPSEYSGGAQAATPSSSETPSPTPKPTEYGGTGGDPNSYNAVANRLRNLGSSGGQNLYTDAKKPRGK